MPKYRVTLSDGRVVTVEADATPSEADVLSALGGASAEPERALIDVNTASLGGLRKKVGDALPNVGGMVGSFVGQKKGGKVGSVVGAGAGGALGAGAQMLLDDEDQTVGEGLQHMAAAGATQAGIEGIGRGVVEPMAKGLYGLALRPIKGVRDKYGLGNLIREGYENAIMPTAAGAKKAGQRVGESKAAQEGMAAAYDAAGKPELPIRAVASHGLKPIMRQAAKAETAIGSSPAKLQAVTDQLDAVYRANPTGTMTAKQMIEAKQAADMIADPAYAKAARTGDAVEFASEPAIAKGFSKGYRQTLNEAVGPEFAAQGQKTKTLFGVKRAAERIAGEPHGMTNLAAGTVGLGTTAMTGGDWVEGGRNALILRAMMSPRAQAAAALSAVPGALYGTRGLDALTGGNAERAMRKALMDLMRGTREEEAPR